MVTAGPTVVTFGTPVTFTVTIQSSAATLPTGSVHFYDGERRLGVVPLDDRGEARFVTADLTVGDHEIRAEYDGDVNFAPSSAIVRQTIGRTTTRTALISSAVAGVGGNVVTLEATVRADGRGLPTGTVTFRDGTTPLATVDLDATGVARLEVPLGWGSHTISALYNGDGAFGPSLATITQVIQALTITNLSTLPQHSTFGQPVDLVAAVSSTADRGITGEVMFTDGDHTLGVVPVDGTGAAYLSVSSLTAGDHTLRAHYGGDTHCAPSAAVAAHHVEKAATTAHLAASVETQPGSALPGAPAPGVRAIIVGDHER
jgi:hypothetical protein